MAITVSASLGRPAGLGVCALVLALQASTAGATILTFDQTISSAAGNPVIPTYGGSHLPPGYGDGVDGAAQSVPGGVYTYGDGGEGFTPDVVFSASTGFGTTSLWEDGYGDLHNVLFGGNNSLALNLLFTAGAGFEVLLYGFDLAGWPNADYLISGVTVSSLGSILFSQSGVLVEGNASGPGHTTFDFGDGLLGQELLLTIDYGNLTGGQHDNIGIDNVRFGQTPPGATGEPGPGPGPGPGPDPVAVPEPGSLNLLAAALALLLLRRRTRAAAPVGPARSARDRGPRRLCTGGSGRSPPPATGRSGCPRPSPPSRAAPRGRRRRPGGSSVDRRFDPPARRRLACLPIRVTGLLFGPGLRPAGVARRIRQPGDPIKPPAGRRDPCPHPATRPSPPSS